MIITALSPYHARPIDIRRHQPLTLGYQAAPQTNQLAPLQFGGSRARLAIATLLLGGAFYFADRQSDNPHLPSITQQVNLPDSFTGGNSAPSVTIPGVATAQGAPDSQAATGEEPVIATCDTSQNQLVWNDSDGKWHLKAACPWPDGSTDRVMEDGYVAVINGHYLIIDGNTAVLYENTTGQPGSGPAEPKIFTAGSVTADQLP